MANQYGQNRRTEDRSERERETGETTVVERRREDHLHTSQLLWSFAVAVCLILAALLQWSAPRNALMEQDRAPAQIRLERSSGLGTSGY
jgi:hypothetical protein